MNKRIWSIALSILITGLIISTTCLAERWNCSSRSRQWAPSPRWMRQQQSTPWGGWGQANGWNW